MSLLLRHREGRKVGGGVPRDGLIGEWLGDGNTLDTSGNGLHGTGFLLEYDSNRKSQANKSFYFSTVLQGNPYVQVSDNSILRYTADTPQLISVWFRNTGTTSSARAIYTKSGGLAASNEITIALDATGVTDTIVLRGNSGTSYLITGLAKNTWHHIVLILRADRSMSWWANGQFVANGTAWTFRTDPTGPVRFASPNGGNRFTGLIDDIRNYRITGFSEAYMENLIGQLHDE